MSHIILGSFELVDLPEFGIYQQIAKVDTGAYSGAIHATSITVDVKNGKKILKFYPFGDKSKAVETSNFLRTFVRSATGHKVTRYVISTTLNIQGKNYKTTIGISNRTRMKKPILLGRRFMRENNMLVDVSLNQEYDDEGEQTT